MAKKDKNSLLNIHYSRTLTSDNLSKAANYVGEYVLNGLGTLGRFLNAGFTSPTYGTTGQVSYARNAEDAKRLRELSEASEQAMGKAMTWLSPLNYGAALATGNGLNARKGEEEVASWSPAWQAVGRLGELYVGPKAVKGVKATPRVVVNTAAKAGVKPAKAAVVVREIKLGIKLNTKNGKIEVTEDYFNSPDKWYRVSERPEKIGIELNGKNVTTSDDPGINGTINGWRESMLSLTGRTIPGKGVNEGYFIFLPRKISLSKHGAAHGNTSQAAKGLIWLGTFAFSDKFPIGVIEGLAPVKIFRGMNNLGKDSRTNFVLLNWEDVPLGARVGFHTGEMPMSNLGWFLKTKNGTYTYEPIISEKRISYQPKLLLDSKTSSTIQISPEELYKVLKDQELNGYYFMGHGTGRTGVNPQTIFDNGLRVKGGDIGNTTMPISESSLTSWPHMNSEEIIIMPGKASMTKYDSAHGHIPSDWYSSDVFHWTDNPKKVGSGPFAAFEPNASFTEQTIGGVPGVYTKPEAVLGSYNTKTHTLKLNPKSLYEFLFNVPKLAEPRTSLAFFERKPAKNNIVGASYDYRMEDPKGSMDFLKQFFALLKINGKEYTLEGLRDAANVQQGLPEHIQSYLNLNTVERAVRAMRKNGYSEREIQLYIDKVNEEMNKVKVGMYSDLEYNAAGALDFGGFYNNESNFISVNRDAHLKDSKFTPEYIMKHEGRHLIDYNTSMTDDVINILEKAYDKDFLEIPKHEDAGSLKDYQHMDRERVTTNRDARDVLLTSKGKYLLNKHDFIIDSSKRGYSTDMIDFLNKIIKYALPEDIVNAVENSNGYGKRYINYLKKNNKLTPAKIEQLRLAMIHVPSYLLPIAGGYTLYNLFNQPLQQLQYLKQGGKINMLQFLKNGSGIHIKKKNRGKFTDYCGGKVTDECIRKAKASGNPTLIKRATFALNARRWKHKEGGKAFVNGVSILDSNSGAYKEVKKKYKMHLYGGEIINESPIVTSRLNWIQSMSDYLQKKNELDLLKKELDLLKKQLQSDMISNIGGMISNYLPDIISSFGKKKSNNNSFNSIGTINSNGSMNTGIGGLTYNWNTDTFGSNNIMNGFNKISLT